MAVFAEFAVAGQEPQGSCRCQAPAVLGDWLLGVKWDTGKQEQHDFGTEAEKDAQRGSKLGKDTYLTPKIGNFVVFKERSLTVKKEQGLCPGVSRRLRAGAVTFSLTE